MADLSNIWCFLEEDSLLLTFSHSFLEWEETKVIWSTFTKGFSSPPAKLHALANMNFAPMTKSVRLWQAWGGYKKIWNCWGFTYLGTLLEIYIEVVSFETCGGAPKSKIWRLFEGEIGTIFVKTNKGASKELGSTWEEIRYWWESTQIHQVGVLQSAWFLK